MRLILQYLKSKLDIIALFLAFSLIFAASFALYRLPLEAVFYPVGLCLLLGVCYAVVDFLRLRKRHAVLEELKHLEAGVPDQLPDVRDVEAADYREIVRLLRDARREDRTRTDTESNAMTEYYTLWAHQIKTPIAAMRLRLQDDDSANARTLLGELGRIEQYVEMVLTYLRLEGDGTDYVIRACDLGVLLTRILRRFAGDFIGRKLNLDYTPVNTTVLTDEKWLSLVIEQVLSNALKYTPKGAISIYLEAPMTLCIRDTGIGIAPEDLPRIFERSYTGLNGRAGRQASGIGLYLCKRICDNLGHEISAQSVPGEGTTIRIDLSTRQLDIK